MQLQSQSFRICAGEAAEEHMHIEDGPFLCNVDRACNVLYIAIIDVHEVNAEAGSMHMLRASSSWKFDVGVSTGSMLYHRSL